MISKVRKILLAARGQDEERDALERALRLAQENGAQLTVLRVVRRPPRDARVATRNQSTKDLERLAIEDAREQLQALVADCDHGDVPVRVEVKSGTPHVEVIRQVVRGKYHLVMLAAQARSRLRRMLFGSMTMQLVRDCPCPVWVVKTGQGRRYSRVLAAVDAWPDNEENKVLSTRILDFASSLAKLENSELHVVHAWHLFAESVLRGRAEVAKSEVDRMAREARERSRARLDHLLAPYHLAEGRDELHLLKGRPELVISRLVTSKHIEVVVLGAGRLDTIEEFLLGNITEKVLSRVQCSVVVIKPDGFRTSIRMG